VARNRVEQLLAVLACAYLLAICHVVDCLAARSVVLFFLNLHQCDLLALQCCIDLLHAVLVVVSVEINVVFEFLDGFGVVEETTVSAVEAILAAVVGCRVHLCLDLL